MVADTNNPANDALNIPKGYRPMSSAQLKMEVPARDGFHRHWFRGTPGRIGQAQQAGYNFVMQEDVQVNNFDLGGDANKGAGTDLGTRVSIVSGDDADNSGQPGRMYLMECPMALFNYAADMLGLRNESVAEALRGGKIGSEGDATSADTRARYVSGATPDLFNPNKSRR